jgi:pimeloyl-ACP methyl ester carboxylesterase
MGVRVAEATLSVVPGAGHAVHLERPEEFLDDVHEFLARCERADAILSQERVEWM